MASALHIVINGPPQPWERGILDTRGGRHRVITPTRTRQYERAVSDFARVQAAIQEWRLTDEPVTVEVHAFFADRRRRDIDNLAKGVLDGLTKSKAIWADDCQVCDLRIVRGYDKERPRTEVVVRVAT